MSNRTIGKVFRIGLAALGAAVLTGCFSPLRISKLDCVHGIHRWSEEKQEYVWQPCSTTNDFFAGFGIYPTMQIRWQTMRLIWNWAPPKYRLVRRTALPCAEILMLPGAVVDVVVDTVSLPWDWKYRGNSVDLVERENKERLCRSLCYFCKKTSEDGDFALVGKTEERKTADWKKRYGVCPECIKYVMSDASWYFDE